MLKSTWREIADHIGPLRYQTSQADCVPTTVINGLLVLYQRQLPAALAKLVWTIGVDFKEGTGYVGARTLAALVDTWFTNAHRDGQEDAEVPLASRIIEGKDVYVGPNSQIDNTLENGGVCCLTLQGGCHYALLLGWDTEGNYLLFDPWWNSTFGTSSHVADFQNYFSLVNQRLSPSELSTELRHRYNRYVHLLEHKQPSR